MSPFVQVTDSISEVCVAVTQEISALVLFVASVYFFKYINQRYGYCFGARRVLPKSLKHAFLHEPQPKSPSAASKPPKQSNRNVTSSSKQRPDGQHRAQEAEARIMVLLAAREFTAALNVYRSFEREGLDGLFTNEAMYGGFIQSAVRMGKLDVVERMLQTMIRNHMTPSVAFWQSLLKILSSRKHYSSCLQVYAMCRHMIPNDKVIFSCLINAALEKGSPEQAGSMLKRYQQCELEPGDYVNLFRTYVAMADADAAMKLALELKAIMTPLMLNLALLTCINAKQPERAMNLLGQAHLFEADNSLAPPGLEMPKIVDTVSYNTVIKGFVVTGDIKNCLKCFETMRIHGLETDDVTLTSLLEISLHDKTGRVTDRLVQTVMGSGRSQSPDNGTCNVFIKGLIRAERLDKAIEVYNAWKNVDGSRPTLATYSMLIKALAVAFDLERALLILGDMVSAGMTPDEVILSDLLEGCRLAGNHELGERLFADMLAAGVQPTEYTLTMMVKLHGRCGAHEKAYQLVEGWQAKYHMVPSVIHYTCVMSGCMRGKKYGLAWAAYQLMEKQGVSPDETTMATLIPAMVAAQMFDRASQLMRRAMQRPGAIKVSTATLNSALAQMLLHPDAQQHAQEMKLLMQAAGVPVTARVALSCNDHKVNGKALGGQ